MRNISPGKSLFVMLAVAALLSLLVLGGCGGDDDRDVEEMMMPASMGYKITVTNNLSEELLAPIVVTHASNDDLLFDDKNYVTDAAEHQILTGEPDDVVTAIGEGVAVGHGTAGPPGVLLPSGEYVEIIFDGDAKALRILAMVAPTLLNDEGMPRYPDNFVSAVADTPTVAPVTVPLSRFDIGYDEGTMEIRLTAENAGTVTIERIGDERAVGSDMMDAATYALEVTNDLSEEFFAPIVATRVNDELYLFTGSDITEAAEHQILFGPPAMVVSAIGEGDATVFHGDAGPPGVLLPAGMSVPGVFETDATALRIIAMVAPTLVPDNYVSAVVNVASLMPGDSVTAPLTRFDIGHDETVLDHMAEMPDHHEMPQMVHRHGDMMTDITLVDDGMSVGTVTITRQ